METLTDTPAQGTTPQDTTARDMAPWSGAYVSIQGSAEGIESALHGLSPFLRNGDITVHDGPDPAPPADCSDPAPPADGSDKPRVHLGLEATASSMVEVCRRLSTDHPDLYIMRAFKGHTDALTWNEGKVGIVSLEQALLQAGYTTFPSYKLDSDEMYVLALLWETIERHRGCGPEGEEFADRLACRVARLGAKAQVGYFRSMMRHTAAHDCSLMQVPLDDIGAE